MTIGMQVVGAAQQRPRGIRTETVRVPGVGQSVLHIPNIGRPYPNRVPAEQGAPGARKREPTIQVRLRVTKSSDQAFCGRPDRTVPVVSRGEADIDPEGGMQLLRIVPVPQAGDGHGLEAKGVRGSRQCAADPGSSVGGQLVRVAGPREYVRGLHRSGPSAPASVDRRLAPVRAVFKERRILLVACEQDDQLSGIVRRILGGADVGQQPGQDGNRVHRRPTGPGAPHDHRAIRRHVHGAHREARHRTGPPAVLQHAMERVRLRQAVHAGCHGRVLVDVIREPARPTDRAQILAVVGPDASRRRTAGRGHGYVVPAAAVSVPTQLLTGPATGVSGQDDHGLCSAGRRVRHHHRGVYRGPVPILPVLRGYDARRPGHWLRDQAGRVVRQRVLDAQDSLLGRVLHDLIHRRHGGHRERGRRRRGESSACLQPLRNAGRGYAPLFRFPDAIRDRHAQHAHRYHDQHIPAGHR